MSAGRKHGAAVAGPAPGVSVVVVSFNTREKLRRCLAEVEPEHELIVVDNASSDGSAAMVRAEFPHARLVENAANVGFGAANNQGMALARAPLVLLLNSDCYPVPGAIARLAQVFADPAVVAAGGRLNHLDGSLQESVAAPPTLARVLLEQLRLDRLAGRGGYWRTLGALRQAAATGAPTPVFQVVGACLMLRPVARFDERFFLYGEDTDLCRRLGRHGAVVYEPRAVFTHELGSSSVGPNRWRSVAHYNRGKELYFALHHGRAAALACLLLDRIGALLRLLVWSLPTLLTLGCVRLFRDRALLFLRVLTAPIEGPRGAGQGRLAAQPAAGGRLVGSAPVIARAGALFTAWLERLFSG